MAVPANDDFERMRAEAIALRRAGKSRREIAEALGLSLSWVSLWVRDMPPPAPESGSHEQE